MHSRRISLGILLLSFPLLFLLAVAHSAMTQQQSNPAATATGNRTPLARAPQASGNSSQTAAVPERAGSQSAPLSSAALSTAATPPGTGGTPGSPPPSMRGRSASGSGSQSATAGWSRSAIPSSSGDSRPGSQPGNLSRTPAELLESGRQHILDGDLVLGQNDFQAVVGRIDATEAQSNEARIFAIFANLALGLDIEGTGAEATALHELLAGFGFPAAGPDLFDFSSFAATLPLPAGSPDCEESLGFVSTSLIPLLTQTVQDLNALPGTMEVSLAEPTTGNTLDVDATDVSAMVAFFELGLFQMHFMVAQGCDIDIDATFNTGGDGLQPNADFMDLDPTLLTTESAADLALARTCLRNAIQAYDLTVARLQSETDDQSNDLVVFAGEDQDEVLDSIERAQEIGQELDQLWAATNGPTIVDLDDRLFTVDMSTPFTTLDLRLCAPTLLDQRVYGILLDPVFDESINGVLPGARGDQYPGMIVPVDSAPAVAPGQLVVGTTGADWTAAGITTPAVTDPMGMDDFSGDPDGAAGQALDVASVFIAQETSAQDPSYFFRVDFDGGTPDPTQNFYQFSLRSNMAGSSSPRFAGQIQAGAGGVFELTLAESTSGVILSPDSSLVGVGDGHLEFSLPKSALSGAGVLAGAEYVVSFRSFFVSFAPFQEATDHAPKARLTMDL